MTPPPTTFGKYILFSPELIHQAAASRSEIAAWLFPSLPRDFMRRLSIIHDSFLTRCGLRPQLFTILSNIPFIEPRQCGVLTHDCNTFPAVDELRLRIIHFWPLTGNHGGGFFSFVFLIKSTGPSLVKSKSRLAAS